MEGSTTIEENEVNYFFKSTSELKSMAYNRTFFNRAMTTYLKKEFPGKTPALAFQQLQRCTGMKLIFSNRDLRILCNRNFSTINQVFSPEKRRGYVELVKYVYDEQQRVSGSSSSSSSEEEEEDVKSDAGGFSQVKKRRKTLVAPQQRENREDLERRQWSEREELDNEWKEMEKNMTARYEQLQKWHDVEMEELEERERNDPTFVLKKMLDGVKKELAELRKENAELKKDWSTKKEAPTK